MPRLGLDYESLAQDNPRLVYASISGFGADGPDMNLGAFDLTIQAVGGYMSITGERGRSPIKLGTSAFDMLAGMNCHSAILAALLQRSVTGKGQKVETSLLEAEVAFLVNAALEYLITGVEPQKWGSEHAQQVPYKAFKTADGWAVIGAGFPNFYEAFCKLLGREDLITDPRFADMPGRVTNREVLYGILDAEVVKHGTDKLMAELEAAKVPCAPVNNMQQVFSHRQVRHRGMQQTLHHPTYGDVPSLGAAAKYSGFEVTAGWTAPPLLGEDSDAVLREWLALNNGEIAKLREAGII
jgi:succinate--hydroxymethylglutarate CoA-transferase